MHQRTSNPFILADMCVGAHTYSFFTAREIYYVARVRSEPTQIDPDVPLLYLLSLRLVRKIRLFHVFSLSAPQPSPIGNRILRCIRYNRKFMLRYFTAGESHGEALVAFLSGVPAGLKIDQAFVDRELWRRSEGYGRGGRMKIERDTAHILSGVRHGMTIGSPISVQLEN